MKKLMLIALCMLVFASLAVAQTYTQGAVGLTGIDKLGAHQNGGRGCVGCHAPHSGARGNGGNAILDGSGNPVDTTDATTGNLALWGQDLSPLYGQTLTFGGGAPVTFAGTTAANEEHVVLGIMMCLSCHDGNIAKGAMMTNQSYEQRANLLPASYGKNPIPTLLGADGTAAGNYLNDHPIGEDATLGAVGLYGTTAATQRVVLADCPISTGTEKCILPNTANAAYTTFINHYGSFNVTKRLTGNDATGTAYPAIYAAGGRANPVVIPTGATTPASAYLTCITCHTPHTMHLFSGNAGTGSSISTGQVLPSYFFIAAPYNPAAPIPDGTKASSATQFCRQCHFTGAGGSNEGSGIMTVTTSY